MSCDMLLKSYINCIELRLENFISTYENAFGKNLKKRNLSPTTNRRTDTEIIIPSFDNIEKLFDAKIVLKHLKIFAKHYKLKSTGTKQELKKRLFVFLYLSKYAMKIQKCIRKFLIQKFNKLKGPAIIKRCICNNSCDFLTFEDINEISYSQFFSFRDTDGFIYGFDIVSIHNLFLNKNRQQTETTQLEEVKNPYNRNQLPENIMNDIKRIVKIGNCLGYTIITKIKNTEPITPQKSFELSCLELFQTINSYGNYADLSWYTQLSRQQLIHFVHKLYDIWNHRASLTHDVKCRICPPSGNPFHNYKSQIQSNLNNLEKLKGIILTIMEKFVYSGVNVEYKTLGSYYVLCALTLVNRSAAEALPWLYESVC